KLPPMKPAPPVTSQVGTEPPLFDPGWALRASERDVVVREIVRWRRLPALGGLLLAGFRRLLPLRARALVRAAATAALAATPEHLHLVGDDVGVVALLAVVADVLAVADPAFDVDLRALAQVLGRDLAELAEEGHPVPLGLFLVVAVAILAHRGGGQADLGDGHAALGVPGFGVVAEIADKDCLVDAAGHGIPQGVAGNARRRTLDYSPPTRGVGPRRAGA